MIMTRDRIEELKRLAEKATQGEWRQCGGMTPAYRAITSPSGYVVFGMADSTVHTEHGNAINSPNFDEQDANARYIAAANPQTILSLLALAERALEPQGQHEANCATLLGSSMRGACDCSLAQPQWQALPEFNDAVKQLRSALSAMMTQFGMDEDETSAGTFKQARKAYDDTASMPDFAALYGETAVQNAELRIAIGAFGLTHEQAVERASHLALPAGPLERIRKALRGRDFNDFPGNDAELLESAANVIAEDSIVLRALPAGPVAWVNSSQLASAKISRERGGPFDLHTWSECKTDFHGSPLYAVNPQPQFHEWDTDGYYAALEKEHLGDPEKGTGIYRPDNCNSPAVAQPVADERAAFEAWASERRRANKLPLSQHANDAYADTRTYLVWYGWQARAALCLPAEEGGKA